MQILKDSKQFIRLPRRQFLIKITLQNSLLGNKYCIHQLLKRQGHSFFYLAINIETGREYLVKFYRLDEIVDGDEMLRERFRIFRRMEVMRRVRSPYVMKCYEMYENQSYMAVVYEYVPEQMVGFNGSLAKAVEMGKISEERKRIIMRHVFQGMDAIREGGVAVKRVMMDRIYFKNGYYKIVDFPMFLSEKTVDEQEEVEFRKDDVWEFGFFYLQLLLGERAKEMIKSQLKKCQNLESVYTEELVKETAGVLNEREKNILRKCLIRDSEKRMSWEELKLMMNDPNNEKIIQNIKQNMSRADIIGSWKCEDRNMAIEQKIQIMDEYIDQQQKYQQFFKYMIYLGYKDVNKFIVNNLKKEEINEHLERKDNKEDKIYTELQSQYFEAQKSNFILNSILKPIRNDNLLDFKERKNIEFMYVVSSRCFRNVSNVKEWFRKLQEDEREENAYLIKQYQSSVEDVYNKCNQYFNFYGEKLTDRENQVKEMAKDLFKKFSNKEKRQEKDKFLNGFEGIDYSKDDIIEYTCRKYLIKMILQLQKEKYQSEKLEKKRVRVLQLLQNYAEICQLNDSDGIKGKDFQECVQSLLHRKYQEKKK